MASPTPLRRELLTAFSVLFAGAVLLASAGLAFLLPALTTPGEAILAVATLVAAVLGGLFLFGGVMIGRALVRPLDRLGAEVRAIADGEWSARVTPFEIVELEDVRDSVNAMADRLIADQMLLAENVASLERTNRELVEARDQVVHAARLASVGTLAAGIAHEVGNPLGAIMAYVDVARKRTADAGGDTDLLDSIRDEARRIDGIVRGLLDHARPKREAMGPTAAGEVIHRVRDLLENQGRLDGVRQSWVVPDGVPPVVMEPHRLEQVLVNLLLNALHALREHQDPCVEVRLATEAGEVERMPAKRAEDPPGVNYKHRRRISRDEGGRGIDPLFTARTVVTIRVSDNGPGIPEDQRDAVFDPFYTTKEPGEGTGLGLSICARLVEGMGGRIEAGASEWGGACFLIRLPAHAGSPDAAEDGAGHPAPAEPRDPEHPAPAARRPITNHEAP